MALGGAAAMVVCASWVWLPRVVPFSWLLLSDTTDVADAVVAYGSTSTHECVLDLGSLQRVLAAVRLYRDGRAPYVVFAGGRANERLRCAASTVMAEIAEREGVPKERIRTETTALNARQAAHRMDTVLRAMGCRRVVLVADALEMRRNETYLVVLGYAVERLSVRTPRGNTNGMFQIATGLYQNVKAWLAKKPVTLDGAAVRTATISLSRSAASPCLIDNPGGPVVMFGTSYAESWQLSRAGGVPVINRGHAGAHTAELARWFDDQVVAARPRSVILWGFDNDLFDPPAGGLATAIAQIEHHYVEMLDRAVEAGIEAILATEVTMGRQAGLYEAISTRANELFGRSTYNIRINEGVLEVNSWLREVAIRRHLLLLDLQPVVSDRFQERLPGFATADGSHISPAGYAALTTYAQPLLDAHFAKAVTCS